jgi:phosphatidylglycerophosphate synthase
VASIVDGSDGEVTRARFMSSKRGGLVDSVFDRVADGFILGGAGYHVLTGSPESWEFAIVLMAVAVAPMSMILKDRFQLATGRKWQSELDDGAARVLLATRDGRLFVRFLGGLLNLLGPALAFVAITGMLLLVWRLVLAWVQMAPGQLTPIAMPVEAPDVATTLGQSGSAAGGD